MQFSDTNGRNQAGARAEPHDGDGRGGDPSRNGHPGEAGLGAGGGPARPLVWADNPEEHEANDQAAAALAHEPDLYHRGGALARVVREDRPPAEQRRERVRRQVGAPRILTVEEPTLRETLSRCVLWWKKNKKGKEVRAHPPDWCVKAVVKRGVWPGLRYLEGVVEAPTLRPDGTVLDRPGYDPDTGLIYAPNALYPPLPAEPTLEDARRAVETLHDLVNEFPFLDDAHKAVWLAALLTVLARPAVEGPTPLFLFEASTAGSGKSLLVKAAGLIATGREPAVSELSADNEEMRKTITAIALEGERAVLFDNASGAFGCKALDAALTTTSWKGRILGASKRTAELPLVTIWFATGNNILLVGDTHRRVIPSRLEPDVENPEERSGFKYPDLLGHIRRNRPELVVAGLTILLAYHRAGRPKANLTHFGSFESWSDVVRQPVCWATGNDPCATREKIRPESRGDVGTLAAILAAWRALPGGDRAPGLTAAAALDQLKSRAGSANPHPEFRVALTAWAKDGEVLPSARQLGNRLRGARGRVVAGVQLRVGDDGHGTATWYVEVVPGTPVERRPAADRHPGCSSGSPGLSGSDSATLARPRARACARSAETDPDRPGEPDGPNTADREVRDL
jgi:hypothetical protein